MCPVGVLPFPIAQLYHWFCSGPQFTCSSSAVLGSFHTWFNCFEFEFCLSPHIFHTQYVCNALLYNWFLKMSLNVGFALRLSHAVCASCIFSSLFHSPQPCAGQRCICYVLHPTCEVLGERLQVSFKKSRANVSCVVLLIHTLNLKSLTLLEHLNIILSFSTKRVDHSNTRLATQLDRNPGM